ncbi:7TM diverse intracellular signaling domain-containing protein [Hymenobacter negativus]|uniref:Chromosome partitioning protein ParA n=1 Tax=Hymenobacter negativus TaxID=2795026 RepID=A0ABS3QMG1_9BACT|nr:7TM diverse intracellular signaling domain-containing protein [Hymenobacter negativus]MBO2011890.1 hypothetical protein [Hymenobacter negativus]
MPSFLQVFRSVLFLLLLFGLGHGRAKAGGPVRLCAKTQCVMLDTACFQVLADASGQLTLAQVQQPAIAARFGIVPEQPYTMRHPGTVYWLRFRVCNQDSTQRQWVMELFDSHVTHVTWYRPGPNGQCDSVVTGAGHPYATRLYQYRDFIFPLRAIPAAGQTYYLKLRSVSRTSLRGILWNEQSLLVHLRNDATWLGVFYGILGIILLYNLCLFAFVRESTYLYYVLYVLSCALLFLTEDGLGFQFLWPNCPRFNLLANCCAPVLLLLQFALYSRRFLDTALHLPRFDAWLKGLAVGSAGLILLDVLLLKTGQSYWVYGLPYGAFYVAAAVLFRRGSRPARFYLAANMVVALSVIFLIARKLGIELLSEHPMTVYSLNIAFVLEVVVLSYALAEKIRGIKCETLHTQQELLKQLRKKQRAQELLVAQLQQNQELKDTLNTELESQVLRRTTELQQQSQTIALRNQELSEANTLLNSQARTIEQLNQELKRDLQQTQEARVLSKLVNFEDFSRIYPNRDACLRYLAELKWQRGFRCRKCGHEKSCDAREPHAQRCTRCGYLESATAYTLLHRCKFDIVKALYSVLLVHTHQGEYSSLALSQVLELRRATCHNFIQKVHAAMQMRQQSADYDKTESWTHVLLEEYQPIENDQSIPGSAEVPGSYA